MKGSAWAKMSCMLPANRIKKLAMCGCVDSTFLKSIFLEYLLATVAHHSRSSC